MPVAAESGQVPRRRACWAGSGVRRVPSPSEAERSIANPLRLHPGVQTYGTAETVSPAMSMGAGFLPGSWDHLGCQSWDRPVCLAGGCSAAGWRAPGCRQSPNGRCGPQGSPPLRRRRPGGGHSRPCPLVVVPRPSNCGRENPEGEQSGATGPRVRPCGCRGGSGAVGSQCSARAGCGAGRRRRTSAACVACSAR